MDKLSSYDLRQEHFPNMIYGTAINTHVGSIVMLLWAENECCCLYTIDIYVYKWNIYTARNGVPKYDQNCLAPIAKMVRVFGMDANIGCSSPLLSTHFLFKTWTLSEEYRSWVENVCHWLYSWHFNVTLYNTYIHICIYQRNLWNCPCWRTFSLSLDWSFMLMFSRWQLLRNYRILTDDKCLGIIIFVLLFSLILISKWTTLQHMNSPRLHKTFFMGDSIFSALYIHNMVIYTGIFVVQTRHETSCLDFVQYTTNLIIRCIVIMVEKYLKRSTKIFWDIFLIPVTKVSIFRTGKYTQNWKKK